MRKSHLLEMIKTFKHMDLDNNDKVSIDEWYEWMNGKKDKMDREDWLFNCGKSFIFTFTVIQIIIGLAS